MKKSTWNQVLIVIVAIVSLVAFSDIFAQDQKAAAKETAQVTAKAPAHQAGSAACLEAHKSGKCMGHDPGACICGGNCGGSCGGNCGATCDKHAAKKKG
jgi:hypothetical protein